MKNIDENHLSGYTVNNKMTVFAERFIFDESDDNLINTETLEEYITALLSDSEDNYFGNRFSAFISNLMPATDSSKKHDTNPWFFLLDRMTEKNGENFKYYYPIETIRSWFKPKSENGKIMYAQPKHCQKTRWCLYQLLFALQDLITEENVRFFFQNIYLGRAYNPRDYREAVYNICLTRNESLHTAEEEIGRLDVVFEQYKEQERFGKEAYHEDLRINNSSSIVRTEGRASSVNEAIEQILLHPDNYFVSLKAANSRLAKLANDILPDDKDQRTLKRFATVMNENSLRRKLPMMFRRDCFNKVNSLMCKDIIKFSKEYAYEDIVDEIYKSDDIRAGRIFLQLLGVIPIGSEQWSANEEMDGKGELYEVTREIRRVFSVDIKEINKAANLSKEIDNEDDARLLMLLFVSYKKWTTDNINDTVVSKSGFGTYSELKQERLIDYLSVVDTELMKANLQPLYPVNSLDALFMWCSMQNNPVFSLRNTVEAISDYDKNSSKRKHR